MPKLFVSAFGFPVLFPKLMGALADFFLGVIIGAQDLVIEYGQNCLK
jgi:hypothetical protein